MKIIKLLTLLFLLLTFSGAFAQNKKIVALKKNPLTFLISTAELDHILSYKTDVIVSTKTNKYVDGSKVIVNTLTGDTRYLKLKLNYFKNAFLVSQVNGKFSTQVFLISDDKSVFYKGRLEHNNYIMTQCSESDIVSE